MKLNQLLLFTAKLFCKLSVKIFLGNPMDLIVLSFTAYHKFVLKIIYSTPTELTHKSQPKLAVKPPVSDHLGLTSSVLGKPC